MGERLLIGLIIICVSVCEAIDMFFLWGSRLFSKYSASKTAAK